MRNILSEKTTFAALPIGAQFQFLDDPRPHTKTSAEDYRPNSSTKSIHTTSERTLCRATIAGATVFRLTIEESRENARFWQLPIGAAFIRPGESHRPENIFWKWADRVAASQPPAAGHGGQASAPQPSPEWLWHLTETDTHQLCRIVEEAAQ